MSGRRPPRLVAQVLSAVTIIIVVGALYVLVFTGGAIL